MLYREIPQEGKHMVYKDGMAKGVMVDDNTGKVSGCANFVLVEENESTESDIGDTMAKLAVLAGALVGVAIVKKVCDSRRNQDISYEKEPEEIIDSDYEYYEEETPNQNVTIVNNYYYNNDASSWNQSNRSNNTMFCSCCGKQIRRTDKFCTRCGNKNKYGINLIYTKERIDNIIDFSSRSKVI